MAEHPDNRSTTRRRALKGFGASVGIGLTGFTGAGRALRNQGNTYRVGFAAESLRDAFKTVFKRTTELYIEGNGHRVISTNAEGDAAKQASQVKNMLNSGIDGLLLDPTSEAAADIVEDATNQGVPVFTANGTVNSGDVRTFVALGNEIAGFQAGKALAEKVRQFSDGGRLFEVQGSQGTAVGVQRSRGFNRAIEEEDDMEVVGQISSANWSQEEVIRKTTSFLQRDEDIDGVYTAWGLAAMGVLKSFERRDLKVKRGKEGYIPIATIDSIPVVLETIRDGFLEIGIGQPVPFYPAIALEFMWDFLDAGKDPSVLPKPGTKLTPDDISIGTTEELDIDADPWAAQNWAPAEVQPWTHEGEDLYPFVKTQAVPVTQENVDDPSLWGNLGLVD